MNDPGNCGMCGRVCPAGSSCMAGVCGTGTTSCPAPKLMCANGCMDVMNDPMNCGMCGAVCAAGVGCQNGKCGGGYVSCQAPSVKCADAAGQTYCTDPNRDPANCGGCGKTCPVNSYCNTGVCQTNAGTVTGPAACPGPTGAPMCVNLVSDPANCGQCGRVCAAGMGCFGGVCGTAPPPEMCPPELKACPDPTGKVYCANVLGDPGNCGACGNVCPPGAACMNANCTTSTGPDGGTSGPDGGTTVSCPVNLYPCNAADGTLLCVDFINDAKNCGGCGNVCAAGTTCQQKVCK